MTTTLTARRELCIKWSAINRKLFRTPKAVEMPAKALMHSLTLRTVSVLLGQDRLTTPNRMNRCRQLPIIESTHQAITVHSIRRTITREATQPLNSRLLPSKPVRSQDTNRISTLIKIDLSLSIQSTSKLCSNRMLCKRKWWWWLASKRKQGTASILLEEPKHIRIFTQVNSIRVPKLEAL